MGKDLDNNWLEKEVKVVDFEFISTGSFRYLNVELTILSDSACVLSSIKHDLGFM